VAGRVASRLSDSPQRNDDLQRGFSIPSEAGNYWQLELRWNMEVTFNGETSSVAIGGCPRLAELERVYMGKTTCVNRSRPCLAITGRAGPSPADAAARLRLLARSSELFAFLIFVVLFFLFGAV
jgi:hypothetical protein